MEGWTIGVIVILVLGFAAIVYGALSDRAKTNRARREILSPPDRVIPRFHPDTPAPQYLSELQARRPPADATSTSLSRAERADLDTLTSAPSTTTVAVGFASASFITDPASGRAVLRRPAVLVCTDGIDSFRELLPVMERHLLSRTPLVVTCPMISKEALSTLEVNHIQQNMDVLAISGCEAEHLRTIAAASGAEPVSRTDLQSGYLTSQHLGRCQYWISDSRRSHLIVGDTAE